MSKYANMSLALPWDSSIQYQNIRRRQRERHPTSEDDLKRKYVVRKSFNSIQHQGIPPCFWFWNRQERSIRQNGEKMKNPRLEVL